MTKRAGVTRKVSLSIHEDDLRTLSARAKRLYRGNLSATVADLIAMLKREEAWARAVAWYGKPLDMSEAEREAIDRELLGATPAAPRRKRAR